MQDELTGLSEERALPSSADQRHPDVEREPEHEEGEHGVQRGE